jgi:hypothetical protein
MSMAVSTWRFILIATALVAPAQVSPAQTQQQQQPPAREDNRWGGLSHQPTEAQVLEQEHAAGLARSPQQQKAVNQDVEQMYQSLMKGTGPGSTTSQ